MNDAAGPVPSAVPSTPGVPTKVVTAAVAMFTLRMVCMSATNRFPCPS